MHGVPVQRGMRAAARCCHARRASSMRAGSPLAIRQAFGACGEDFQDELGTCPDERCVLVEEVAYIAEGQLEGPYELAFLGLRIASLFHLGEYDLNRLVGQPCRRESRLGQKSDRLIDVGAQAVSCLFAQLAVDAFPNTLVRFLQSCGERDAPGVQGIAELADHEQRAFARFAHDANGVNARCLAAGVRQKARTVHFELLARCALVHVVGAVGQLVSEDILVDPTLADLLDVLQLRNAAGCCCVHLPILCLAVVRRHDTPGTRREKESPQGEDPYGLSHWAYRTRPAS